MAFTKNLSKRMLVGALALALFAGSIGPVHASSSAYTFTRDLTLGASGAEVTALQTWLISKGYNIPAGATGYFGAQTAAALSAYQRQAGITPAAGYFGPITRAKVNASGSVTPTPTNPKPSDLSGGAGSVEEYELVSSINNEKVGESEEDVEVLGLEITADDGSDLRLTAARVTLAKGTATKDFKKYADEVSIMLDGDEVARVDAKEFTRKNNWSKTISLDSSAIIRKGDTGTLTVAVSGLKNIDSATLGQTWTADISSLRYSDAQGATVSEDPGTAARTFSFVSFASAANVELKITNGDEDINRSRTIQVDTNKDTEGEEVLSFKMEVKGDSDVTLDSLPVEFTVTGAGYLDEVAHNAYLMLNGDEVGSANIDADENTVVFEDLDLTLKAGKKYEFTVALDLNSVDGALDNGDTVTARIGETETNSADFDAEDESGENLADADISGSATGGAHAFFDSGIAVTFVSASEQVTATDGADNDLGTFTIKYRVEAFGDTVYVSDSAAATTADTVTAATVTGSGVLYQVEGSGTATTEGLSSLVTWKKVKGSPTKTVNGVELNEGDAAEFTLTVVRTNSGTSTDDGIYRALLKSIGWNTDDSTTFNVYNFDLEDYKTDPISLN